MMFTSETVLMCFTMVVVSCQLIDATIFSKREDLEEIPVAEDRIFKGKKLFGKKKNFLSFTHNEDPQVYHTLSPIEHYPIWKVHKYKGVEFRPVQVIDLPAPFDYSAVKNYQYGVPAVDSVRIPHTEYGVPVVDYNSFGGVVQPEEPTKIVTGGDIQFHAPSYHHGGKLKKLFGLLTAHRNLLAKLKSWKLGVKQGIPAYGMQLPEVQEIPIKGLENLNFQVPELPPIDLSSYNPPITAGPYVKVQVSSPAPAVNYAAPEIQPQYAPQYQYQYPPQYSTDYSLTNQFYQPTQGYQLHFPAPYYGAPPLFDSYGMPLPPDAYSSASSNQILTFAVPDNSTQLEERAPENVSQEEYNDNNGELNVEGSVKKIEELTKFLPEEDEKREESIKVFDQTNNNNNNEKIIINN